MSASPVVADSSSILLFGMGNPLLDISAVVPQSVLDAWGVTLNNAILAEAKHEPMYAQLVKDYPVEYIAGGATQNSVRVAQWMLPPGSTAYTGCIGADSFGEQLRKSATADGVNALYQVNPTTPTGTCAVLIKDHERSLIAHLAAANKFTPDHLDTIQAAMHSAKIFYSSGFFLTVSPPAFQIMAKHSMETKKITAINLAAPFIPQFFAEPLHAAIAVAEYVFGNEGEAESFAKQQKLEKTDAETVALFIAAMPKTDASRPRTCIITQGPHETVVAFQGKAHRIAVPPLAKDQIVDVNGAGDAFVGGFLAQIALGKDVDEAVRAGHFAARTILQTSGTVLPASKPPTSF